MNDKLLPVFVKTEVNGHDLFLQTEMCAYDSPKESIWQYRRHNFLATINAVNIPLGSYEPKDSSFLL